jgi:hypothetical protein
MHTHGVSRRRFVLGSAAAFVAGSRLRAQSVLTAQQVVERIKAKIGMPWRTNTVDGIKAGDASTVVTGIATTPMATIDVLRRATASRQNFIVTQEPVFYAANDEAGARATDPVYLAKQKIIADGKLVVYRLSDHWSARKPNESAAALADALGIVNGRQAYSLTSGAQPSDWDSLDIHEISETRLGDLAARVRSKLSMRGGLRLVGDPALRVKRVFIAPEGTTLAAAMKNLPRADAIIAGEPREWEAIPYTLDTAQTGSPKGMIYIGRVVSEGPGMRACATWLKSLVPEVPVSSIAVDDPYWSAIG